MTFDLKAIIAAVPRLSPDELTRLEQAIKASRSLGAGKGPAAGKLLSEYGDDELQLLVAITDFMRAIVVDLTGADQLRNHPTYKAFAAKVPGVMKFVARAGKDRVRQRALLKMGLELLHEDLSAIGLAATSRTMMAHIHRVPALIDRQFPGYAQAGLLGLIIQQEQKHVRNKQGRAQVQRHRRTPEGS